MGAKRKGRCAGAPRYLFDRVAETILVQPCACTSGIALHIQFLADYAVSLLPRGTFGGGTRSVPLPSRTPGSRRWVLYFPFINRNVFSFSFRYRNI